MEHRDQIGRTQLARACASGDVESVRVRLQERPQDLNLADHAGNTPLQIASLEGITAAVELLIAHGANVNCVNNDKDTPLIDAVENSHLDVVRLLLKAGANPKQCNLHGAEPLELIQPDHKHAQAIKQALEAAIRHPQQYRPADDRTAMFNSVVGGGSTGSGSGGGSGAGAGSGGSGYGKDAARAGPVVSPHPSPPLSSAHSPSASNAPLRRKTVRSEATRNDLLWMKPTLENLRECAGKGDIAGVANILNILNRADSESLIAAARGGHDEVMQLLLGIGGADADPEPLKGYKEGYNTPMLAAIGRENDKVVALLLDQPNFDPTRRDAQGRTYHEIARDRQGVHWWREYTYLKESYVAAMRAKESRNTQPQMPSTRPAASAADAVTAGSTKAMASEKKPPQAPTHRTHDSNASAASRPSASAEHDRQARLNLSGKSRAENSPAAARKPATGVGGSSSSSSNHHHVKEKDQSLLPSSSTSSGRARADVPPSSSSTSRSRTLGVASDADGAKTRRKPSSGKDGKDRRGRSRPASPDSGAATAEQPKQKKIEALLSSSTPNDPSARSKASSQSGRRSDVGSGKERRQQGKSEARGGSNALPLPPRERPRAPGSPSRAPSRAGGSGGGSNSNNGAKRARVSTSPRGPRSGSPSRHADDAKKRRKVDAPEEKSKLANRGEESSGGSGGGGGLNAKVVKMTRSPEEGSKASEGFTRLVVPALSAGSYGGNEGRKDQQQQQQQHKNFMRRVSTNSGETLRASALSNSPFADDGQSAHNKDKQQIDLLLQESASEKQQQPPRQQPQQQQKTIPASASLGTSAAAAAPLPQQNKSVSESKESFTPGSGEQLPPPPPQAVREILDRLARSKTVEPQAPEWPKPREREVYKSRRPTAVSLESAHPPSHPPLPASSAAASAVPHLSSSLSTKPATTTTTAMTSASTPCPSAGASRRQEREAGRERDHDAQRRSAEADRDKRPREAAAAAAAADDDRKQQQELQQQRRRLEQAQAEAETATIAAEKGAAAEAEAEAQRAQQQQRDALPYMLQRLAELPLHLRQTSQEAVQFLPLLSVERVALESHCRPEAAKQLWIANFQAAAVLGLTDMAFPQCMSFLPLLSSSS
jgi:hypothetical protein